MLRIEKTQSGPRARAPAGRELRLLRAATLYAVVLIVCLGIWIVAQPTGQSTALRVSEVFRLVGPLSFVPFCLRGLPVLLRTDPTRRSLRDWVPVLLGLGIACFSVGRAISAVHIFAAGTTLPFPSVADVAFLGAYPCILLGILFLPSRQSTVARARVMLDMFLILTGVAAFTWYYVIGPAIVAEHASVIARAVNIAYPVADLSLICCMLLLWTLFRDVSLRRVVILLGLALFVLIGADSLREYEILNGTYRVGSLLDLGRPLGYMVLGLAALATRLVTEDATGTGMSTASVPSHRPLPRVWRYLLPYASVPTLFVLIIVAAQAPGYPPLEVGVYAAGALLIELVFLHQFLDYRELIAFSNRNARLESLAAADPVTGLPNHRTIVSALDVELERARRYHHPCTVLFMDLDHFKALNDSYGHPAGDAALREFASVVRTALRGVDILGRWGGEEFMAMLPETGTDAASMVAERVRSAVAAHTFWAAGGAHVTCSIGAASFPADAESRDELIEMADRAVYAAKNLGRNQVRAANDPAVAVLEANTHASGVREEAALLGTVEALAAVVEARNVSGSGSSAQIAALATRLALDMGLDTSDAYAVGLAARVHDVGKVTIPDTILNKAGRLTEEEWTLIRTHPSVSASVVSRVPALRVLSPIVRAHHEHWNGAGYPDGLAGEAIPLCARILAVADAYAAITSERPYRPARSAARALTEIERCSGTQFDPDVVAALGRILQPEEQVQPTVA